MLIRSKHFFWLNIAMIIVIFIAILGLVPQLAGSIRSQLGAKAETDTSDKTPPQISEVEITDITSSTTIVKWKTNELSDSLVNYGLDKNYGMAHDPLFKKDDHSVTMTELIPNTTYFFRITSYDANGNQGISSNYSFSTKLDQEIMTSTTTGTGKGKLTEGNEVDTESTQTVGGRGYIEEGEEESFKGNATDEDVQEILKSIQQVRNEDQLEEIQAQVQKTAEEEVKPPTIILDIAQVEVGTDYAIITWKTDKESDSIAAIAPEGVYNPNAADPYQWKVGEPDRYVKDHRVYIGGLKPATQYHFQVASKSQLGLTGKSGDNIFKTKSVAPVIENLSVRKVEEDSATLSWVTNVPCSAIVEYTNLQTNETKLEGNTNYITVHTVQLKNLKYDTYYSAVIRVENEEGDKVVSDPITFLTTIDKVPPIITKVNTESTLYPGTDNKIQAIINWETDELAVCQLFYQKGLISSEEPEALLPEVDLATKHVQVATNFFPATVYKFWVSCKDDVGNEGKSANYTLLTPSQEESIIDIIIKNFQSAFGWVKGKK